MVDVTIQQWTQVVASGLGLSRIGAPESWMPDDGNTAVGHMNLPDAVVANVSVASGNQG